MTELVRPVESAIATRGDGKWWRAYDESLRASGFSSESRRVLDLDCTYLQECGIFGDGDPSQDASGWPDSRVRTGLTIGAIQSGKTASMFGVLSKAIDSGVDIIVLLTGTKVGLWQQTVRRFYTEFSSLGLGSSGAEVPLIVPAADCIGSVSKPTDLYGANPRLIARKLEKGLPLVILAMKHGDHLAPVRELLRKAIAQLDPRGRRVSMLVLDDEADDGSILDPRAEDRQSSPIGVYKGLPRQIANVWASTSGGESFHPNLFTTYLAYTATPQSNLIQSRQNPLSPRHFVTALRTPGPSGSIDPPRETNYAEPKGLGAFYTGGEYFYRHRDLPGEPLCVRSVALQADQYVSEEEYRNARAEQVEEMVVDGLRSFLVGAAIRLLNSGKRFTRVKQLAGHAKSEVQEASPSPHSMLVHPSSSVREHYYWARWIVNWSEASGGGGEVESIAAEEYRLDPSGLIRRLGEDESAWRGWMERFRASRDWLQDEGGAGDLPFCSDDQWDDVRQILIDEIFPNVRLSILNSESADEFPRFDPQGDDDKAFPARDLLTIFVAGNVLSRGLTLEGLATSVFLRGGDDPAADTQMQMQRWFGYRGSFLNLCRVFLHDQQFDHFADYHADDVGRRSEIINKMNEGAVAPTPMVLSGANFRATGKIANIRAVPLSPGPNPFITLIARREEERVHNVEKVAELLAPASKELTGFPDAADWDAVKTSGATRGILLRQTFSLLEVASFLESLRFESHDPDPSSRDYERWRSLQGRLGLIDPLLNLHGNIEGLPLGTSLESCPYNIAAYLRLWSALLDPSVLSDGFRSTDEPNRWWNLRSPAERAQHAPEFRVGIKFGSLDSKKTKNATLKAAGVRLSRRAYNGSHLAAGWGSRNPEIYLGDESFDYHITGLEPGPSGQGADGRWRPRGHPGLVLLQLIEVEQSETVTVGLCIPHGGPDLIPCLREL